MMEYGFGVSKKRGKHVLETQLRVKYETFPLLNTKKLLIDKQKRLIDKEVIHERVQRQKRSEGA